MHKSFITEDLIDNKEKYFVRVFFFRENWFIGLLFVTLFLYAAFLLPPTMQKPQGKNAVSVFFFVVLLTSVVFFILTDHRKPLLIKRLMSVGLIIVFCTLFYFYSGAKWNLIITRFFNLEALDGILLIYWSGLKISLILTLSSIGFAVFIGLIIGVLRSLHNPVFEIFLSIYVNVFRSIPLIALMIFIFYALPFLSIKLGSFSAATLSIVLMYSAYIAEIFRAGIEAIDKIQVEAAATLGLTTIQSMRLIILPQALRVIIPPLTNSLVGILKDTSVAYVVTLPELLAKAQQTMINRHNPTPLVFVSFVYLLILFPMTKLAGALESKSKRWTKQAIR